MNANVVCKYYLSQACPVAMITIITVTSSFWHHFNWIYSSVGGQHWKEAFGRCLGLFSSGREAVFKCYYIPSLEEVRLIMKQGGRHTELCFIRRLILWHYEGNPFVCLAILFWRRGMLVVWFGGLYLILSWTVGIFWTSYLIYFCLSSLLPPSLPSSLCKIGTITVVIISLGKACEKKFLNN